MFSDTAFANKVFLIAGGSKGIGKECAEQIVKFGGRVAISGRDAHAVDDAVSKIQQFAPGADQILGIQSDISSLIQIENMVDRAREYFGRIDVLVNSAGTNIRTNALEVTEGEWDSIMAVNLKGAFFTAQAFARTIANDRVGRVINISSQYGHVGSANRVAYCASKGGLELMTKALAVEWAPKILVNSVCPTFIETDLTRTLLQSPDVERELVERIPMGRFGTPEDVSGAVLYLASDFANMVTGTSLLVDGGWTAS